MRLAQAIQTWILNTLFPPRCVSCKTEGDFLCKKCVQSFVKKRISRSGSPGDEPKEWRHLDGVIYALDYAKNPSIKAAIEQFKYKFNQELAGYFSTLIVEKIGELGMIRGKRLCFIPVPLHRKRLAWRGFNQAQVIAEKVAAGSSLPIEITPLLERVRHTEQQAKLRRHERLRNLTDAFRMNKKFVQYAPDPDALYFLVDDVCSTGATLENAAKTLKEHGLQKIYGLVVARAFK